MVMHSIFDDPEFNRRLFLPPLPDTPPPREGVRDAYVDVADGIRIHGRLHDHPNARATLILFHGNGEDVTDYDQLAPRFAGMGLSLAVFGYRGYAGSDGIPTLRTIMEDTGPIFHWLTEQDTPGSGRPVLVMGRSLGSGPAIELVCRQPHVAGLILESGYADPCGMIRRRGYDPPPLTDEELSLFSNQHKICGVTVPLLILHGAEDTLILPDEAVANHHAAGTARRELVVLNGVGHNDISRHPRYYCTIEAFVNEVVPEVDT
jgi:alpha-beta hydrolase superfamily lysophospholipase